MFSEIEIQADYDTPANAGFLGTFQIISIFGVDEDGNKTDLTERINQGQFYRDADEVLKELKLDDLGIEATII